MYVCMRARLHVRHAPKGIFGQAQNLELKTKSLEQVHALNHLSKNIWFQGLPCNVPSLGTMPTKVYNVTLQH